MYKILLHQKVIENFTQSRARLPQHLRFAVDQRLARNTPGGVHPFAVGIENTVIRTEYLKAGNLPSIPRNRMVAEHKLSNHFGLQWTRRGIKCIYYAACIPCRASRGATSRSINFAWGKSVGYIGRRLKRKVSRVHSRARWMAIEDGIDNRRSERSFHRYWPTFPAARRISVKP